MSQWSSWRDQYLFDLTTFLTSDFYSHRHPADCFGYFTIWRVMQRRRRSCMMKWSPSLGLMEILPQRALQSWLTGRLVSKRACGNERIPLFLLILADSSLTCPPHLPIIHQFISWPWVLGGSLTKLPQTIELPNQRPFLQLAISELPAAKPFIWKCVPPTGSFSGKSYSSSDERFGMMTRFETEAQGNSEMAYSNLLDFILHKFCEKLV